MRALLCILGFHKWEYRVGVLIFYRTCQRCWITQTRYAIVERKWRPQ